MTKRLVWLIFFGIIVLSTTYSQPKGSGNNNAGGGGNGNGNSGGNGNCAGCVPIDKDVWILVILGLATGAYFINKHPYNNPS